MRYWDSIALIALLSFTTTTATANPRWTVPPPDSSGTVPVESPDPAQESSNPAFRVVTDAVYVPPAPLPPPEPEPAPEPAPIPAWFAPAGASVQETIAQWGASGGWVVLRKTTADYRLVAPLSYSGTFFDAVRALLLAHVEQPRPLQAFAYPNQQPAPLLVVTE